MAAITSAILGGIGLAGAAASAFGKQDPKFDYSGINSTKMADQGALGASGQSAAQGGLSSLMGLGNDESFGARKDLASMFQQYSQGGYMPTEQDNQTSRSFAKSQFDPQRVAMQQAFQDQFVQANRQAALSGRGINDPILRAKLAQEQTRQQAQLGAEEGAFATKFAMNQPMQRLQFAEGRTNVLAQNFQQKAGLANNIFQQGLAAQGQDYNQRFGQYQAELGKQMSLAQMAYGEQKDSKSFGERLGQTLSGGFASFGAGMSAAPALNSILGYGSPQPSGGTPLFGGARDSNPGWGITGNSFSSNPFSKYLG